MIQQLKADYAGRPVCEAPTCPTSTAYYAPKRADENDLVAAIEQVLLRFPFYGYRKVLTEL